MINQVSKLTWIFGLICFFYQTSAVAGERSSARDVMRRPIMPGDKVETPVSKSDINKPKAANKKKNVKAIVKKTKKRAESVSARSATHPGQIRFSPYQVGGGISKPRVQFDLNPAPLSLIEEPIAMDYEQQVRDTVEKREPGF